jgi:SWI/SNF-related matrix-associated actin-dependent regulator 1 of chromatin subfamily A
MTQAQLTRDFLALNRKPRPIPKKEIFEVRARKPGLELMPHQAELLENLITVKDGRGILGLKVGEGKTPPACMFASYYGPPVLINVPNNKRKDWKTHLKEWCGLDSFIVEETTDSIDHPIVIIGHDRARVMAETLQKRKWRTVIVDEAHKLKNIESERSKAIIPIARKSDACLFVTGTPQPNRTAELFPLLHGLYPRYFPDRYMFATRYCAGYRDKWGHWQERGASNLDELSRVMKASMVRLDKPPFELPEKTELFHTFDSPEEFAKRYESAHARYIQLLQNSSKDNSKAIKAMCSELYLMTQEEKEKVVLDHAVNQLKAAKGTSLVFMINKKFMRTLSKKLTEADVSNCVVNGDVKEEKRGPLLEKVIAKETKVAIVSYVTCGAGLNLMGIENVYLLQLPYTPSDAEQAIARIHRYGTSEPITAYWYVMSPSYDDHILGLLDKKTKIELHVVCGIKPEEEGDRKRPRMDEITYAI